VTGFYMVDIFRNAYRWIDSETVCLLCLLRWRTNHTRVWFEKDRTLCHWSLVWFWRRMKIWGQILYWSIKLNLNKQFRNIILCIPGIWFVINKNLPKTCWTTKVTPSAALSMDTTTLLSGETKGLPLTVAFLLTTVSVK